MILAFYVARADSRFLCSLFLFRAKSYLTHLLRFRFLRETPRIGYWVLCFNSSATSRSYWHFLVFWERRFYSAVICGWDRFWRKLRDSNSRSPLGLDGFQDRCNKPLCQTSLCSILRLQIEKSNFEKSLRKPIIRYFFAKKSPRVSGLGRGGWLPIVCSFLLSSGTKFAAIFAPHRDVMTFVASVKSAIPVVVGLICSAFALAARFPDTGIK